jgi:RNA polymerase sigma-70 factor (ECF subfamily)
MAQTDAFADLMARLRAGDETAAADVFHRFARRLIGLARSHLDSLLRAKVDPEDVMQSAFKSFFAHEAERPYALEDWDSLWGLLACITVRKCGHRLEHFRTARRDLGREVPAPGSAEESRATWQLLAREPTPMEAMILAETVQGLMQDLGERDRQILQLSLQGHGVGEVSAQVCCTERTVYRTLAHVKARLEAMRAEADEA